MPKSTKTGQAVAVEVTVSAKPSNVTVMLLLDKIGVKRWLPSPYPKMR